MRTVIYVDGFNLYYRALKGTRWKWLDLPALFEQVLKPHHDILAVKYFTAKVRATSKARRSLNGKRHISAPFSITGLTSRCITGFS